MRFISDAPFFFLWFGAAVSLSEVLAGTLLAPMGLERGLAAIVIGHLIGTSLLVLGGLIGTREGQTAMGTTEAAFGPIGRRLFAGLNVIQLIGWTAVMLATGASQAAGLVASSSAHWPWIVLLAVLLAGWAAFARAGIGRMNLVAVSLLICLLLAVFFGLYDSGSPSSGSGSDDHSMRFGAGLELVIVMPLSWLPLIADYNRYARNAVVTSIFTWLGYSLGSIWMYTIGLLMSLQFGGFNLGAIVSGAPAVGAALAVIILSTVTTTFLDVHSAAVSSRHLSMRGSVRGLALVATVVATLVALCVPIRAYEGFLYMVGALFSPLYAVVISRYLVLRRTSASSRNIAWPALLIWCIGVAVYYGFAELGTPIGATLPAFAITAVLYIGVCLATPERLPLSKPTEGR